MKLFPFVFCMILAFDISAQDFQENSSLNSINYISINSYTSPIINITSIDDFIKLIDDNNTTVVFYTEKLFLIQGTSIMYVIDANGYNNITDYKNGNDRNFINGESYYFALENNLPNQGEVDYYKQEGFLTNADYQEASLLGFTHSNITERRIYGLITENDLRNNLRYLNIIVYLISYKNWQAMEDQVARQNAPQLNTYSYNDRDRIAREQENARLQRERLDQEGLQFIENSSIEELIAKFGRIERRALIGGGYSDARRDVRGEIRKLNYFDYYLVDIPLESEKDSIFYYACKFCQYSNINEYRNNNTVFTLKETEQIMRRFSFDSIRDFLDADTANIPNGNDYNLIFSYNITLEQLNQNRTFILELESIKQRYLSNLDVSSLGGDREKINFRAIEVGRNRYGYQDKANIKEIVSFIIYNLLRQQRGIPMTYTNFINDVQREYSNNSIYRNLSFDQRIIMTIFEQIPQINNLFVISNDSFYLR
jgi:hypothetical protein